MRGGVDVEATAAENYVDAKQTAPEAARTILLMTPIEEISAQIPLLLAPTVLEA
jgi:hypothetical protein